MTEDLESAVVFDFGSGYAKAGFVGEDQPRVDFPSIVGRTKYNNQALGEPEIFVGDNALQQLNNRTSSKPSTSSLKISRPIERSVITSWEDAALLLTHTYSELLQVDSQEHPLIFSETPLNSENSREKLCELVFEAFNVPKFFLINQANACLYSTARTDGVVVDSGYGTTRVLPIADGFSCLHSFQRLEYGGFDLNLYLKELLMKKYEEADPSIYKCLQKTNEFIFEEIKEKSCYISNDYRLEQHRCDKNSENFEKPYNYVLPDGTNVALTLDNELFRVPELLLRPSLVNNFNPNYSFRSARSNRSMSSLTSFNNNLPRSSRAALFSALSINGSTLLNPNFSSFKSIQDAVCESIAMSEEEAEMRKTFFKNIILTGGNMNFKGMDHRMQKLIKHQAPPDTQVQVYQPASQTPFVEGEEGVKSQNGANDSTPGVVTEKDNRKYSVFVGSSIMGSLSTIREGYITRQEYEEDGVAIVKKKISMYD